VRFRKLKLRETRPVSSAVRKQRDNTKRRRFRSTFTVVVLVIVGLCVAYWFWSSQWILTRGRVVASTVAIAATKTGRLTEVLVTEGQTVQAGQPVARLDQTETEAQLKEAQARLAEARIKLVAARDMGVDPQFQSEMLEAESERYDADGEARNLQARIDALAVDLEQARINMGRAERLYLLQVITRPEWEAATARHRSLEAQSKVLRSELQTQRERARRVGGVLELARVNLVRGQRGQEALVDQLEERIAQAEERVAAIMASFELREIVASRDGIVTWIYAEPGDVVDHNDTLITLVDESDRWIEAYVEADDLVFVKAGQRAVISFKGLVGGTYEGRVVEYVSRYANLKAKPRVGPDQVRTPLRLGRVAHPVRITIDEPLPANIRPEMVASVRIKK
jgi:multidrug resistance efflux pump